ncbi:MAG: IS4 family transposase [Gammaproteobacteria bacterium]|nr:IS4 family transposase [Gammaproteobacteria bacterium]
MDGAHLTLSGLGRRLDGESRAKHKIKCIDRLRGNPRLHTERAEMYKAMTHWAPSGPSRPVIAIDWSDMETGNRYQMLKAAAIVEGRALTLYEEVHPVKGCKRGKAERLFLRRLATLVPAQCTPIIVTDAGFLGPWFKTVRAFGWDYVGRVRGQQKIRFAVEKDWRPIKELHALASASARTLGKAFAAQRHPYETRVCLVQEFKAKPGRRRADRPTNPKWREPGVLFTSLDEHLASAAVADRTRCPRHELATRVRRLGS